MRVGRTTQLYIDTAECADIIISGCVVSIDPSVGSESSMPGYAVYKAGIYKTSGILQIELGHPLAHRLNQVRLAVEKLYKKYKPDVLVYENIAPRSFGRNAYAHASLLKGVGAIMSAGDIPYRPKHVVGIKPSVWKHLVRDTYRKSDEADSVEMGHIVIELAQYIEGDADGKRNSRLAVHTGVGGRGNKKKRARKTRLPATSELEQARAESKRKKLGKGIHLSTGERTRLGRSGTSRRRVTARRRREGVNEQ